MTAEGNHRQSDKNDTETKSMIMTLQEIGFTEEEIELYLQLQEKEGSAAERLHILNQKRADTLEQIHLYEKKMDWMDYLRHQIRCGQQK